LPVPERVLTQRVQDVMSAEEIQDHREFLQRTDRAEARNLPVKETLVAFDQMVAEGIFAPFASVANYDPSFITLKQLRKRVMAQIKFDPAVIEAFRSDGDFENNLQQHWDSAADLVLGQMKRDGQSLHSGNPKTMIPALQRALLTQIEGEARKASNAENRPDATTKVEDERSTGEEGDLFQQPEAQGTPLSEITIKYVGELQLFDENGDPLATEATADIALAEVDQQIETIRKFRECLLS